MSSQDAGLLDGGLRALFPSEPERAREVGMARRRPFLCCSLRSLPKKGTQPDIQKPSALFRSSAPTQSIGPQI